VWIFGAWYGRKFSDNSKYLFFYVSTCHPEIKAIWLTHNRQVLPVGLPSTGTKAMTELVA
jgi:hypothetical protein